MNKPHLYIVILVLLFPFKSFCQGFLITRPILEFDGSQLMISYDILSNKEADQFYVWIEIERENEELIKIEALSGDVGDKIIEGKNKKIIWIPEKDSIFLNEEILVEVKAEKRVKSFNRGSMMLLSASFPGLGQTKISKGKPWWLAGVTFYGFLTAGIITHKSYLKTYNSYTIEEDVARRSDLFTQSQKELNISNTFLFTGATLWAANICWVALIPERFQPLLHAKLSLDQSSGPAKGATLLTFQLDF